MSASDDATRHGPSATAIVFDRYGPPDVLRVARIASPSPGDGDVRVRVLAAGVNPLDVKVRRGDLDDGSAPPFPQRLGNEFAGVVETLGPSVDSFHVGLVLLPISAVLLTHQQPSLKNADTSTFSR